MSPLPQIKDTWQEQRLTTVRIIACSVMMLLLISLVITRLAQLQVSGYEYYSAQSQGNRIRVRPVPPPRGLIYDRNGAVLAENLPAWHLEITAEQIDDLDDTLQRLAAAGLLETEAVETTAELVRSRRRFDAVAIRRQLSDEEVARFAVLQPYFPGVEIRAGLARNYPNGNTAAHALGYMGAMNVDDKERLDPAAYAGTSYIGKIAIERSYEMELHGQPGHNDTLVNAHGRVIQVLQSERSVPGQDLVLTLDLPSQQAAELALAGKRGAAVALDPNNGEVLVFASSPPFDPNSFTGGISTTEYRALQMDHDQPLFNRALRGRYPPGSTIKPILGLAAMHKGTTPHNHKMFCRGYYSLPGKTHRYRDWKPEGHGMVDMEQAIAQSCDTYFYELAVDLGIDEIEQTFRMFGLGERTGIDIGGESPGLVPGKAWKKANFRNKGDQVWFPGETVITGIGQGYLLSTPLQLAEATAVVAARGERYQPMLVKAVRDPVTGTSVMREPLPKAPLEGISDANWQLTIDAMREVVSGTRGTARALNAGAKFPIAGKSGTAQVFSVGQDEEYDEEEIAERMRDHALFVAFAPVDDPQIAVAVIVENGGSGSGVAAPVARVIIDTYLSGVATQEPEKPAAEPVMEAARLQ